MTVLPTTYADLVKLLDLLTEHFPEFRETLSRSADEVDAHERRTKRITGPARALRDGLSDLGLMK